MNITVSSLSVALLILLSGVHIAAASSVEEAPSTISQCTETLLVPKITLQTQEEYLTLTMEGDEGVYQTPGQPQLPYLSKTFTFPFGTKITGVVCTFSDIEEQQLTAKIQPAPQPIPKTGTAAVQEAIQQYKAVEDSVVYESEGLFPQTPYEYDIRCGLQGEDHILFVTVRCSPVQYAPATDTIQVAHTVEVTLSYEQPLDVQNDANEVDLVIIAPRRFSPFLLPLVLHKNLHGMKTKLKTTEAIYRESFLGTYDARGRDKPEQIKYFIKHAVDTWGVKYVMLVGGRQHQQYDWYVPVRYSNLNDRSFWNESYVSDLYYADLYRYDQQTQQVVFEDWDSNGNGVLAEWTWIWDGDLGYWYDLDSKDVLDLIPDVYVGRLACRTIKEVRTIVNKIIAYERKPCGRSWFNTMVLIGGDTVPFDEEYYEGEIETAYAASFMEPLGFTTEKLWVSNGELTGGLPVITTISEGAGFLYLSGHGTPIVWSTHPPGDDETWIDGLYTMEMSMLRNRNELPICVVGGCHNSQFAVTRRSLLRGVLEYGPRYFLWDEGIECFGKFGWASHCWSWNLVRQDQGGAIAAIGNTGLGWGISGPNCINYQDGYICSHFFQVYATLSKQGYHNLGMIHGQTITDYVNNFQPNEDELDRKTVEQWALLGDPSLCIGGYS